MPYSKQNNLVRILVPVFFILMLVVNALANILPLNGLTTGAVSDAYTNLFTPSAYTFSIWGVIYFFLLGYTLYHVGVLPLQERHHDLLNQTGLWFLFTCLLNSAWIVAWHFKLIWLSLVIMLFLLGCLIKIALVIAGYDLTPAEKWVVQLPFSVYFGWITIATIANTTVFLVSLHWGRFGFSAVFWTVAILMIGALIGLITAFRFRDIGYTLVFIWAYYGIFTRHYSKIDGYGGQYPAIMITTIAVVTVFALMGAWMLYRNS